MWMRSPKHGMIPPMPSPRALAKVRRSSTGGTTTSTGSSTASSSIGPTATRMKTRLYWKFSVLGLSFLGLCALIPFFVIHTTLVRSSSDYMTQSLEANFGHRTIRRTATSPLDRKEKTTTSPATKDDTISDKISIHGGLWKRTSAKYKLLVLVPDHYNPNNLPILQESLHSLHQQSTNVQIQQQQTERMMDEEAHLKDNKDSFDFGCIIRVSNLDQVHKVTKSIPFCQVKIGALATNRELLPELSRIGYDHSATHVSVLIDNVDLAPTFHSGNLDGTATSTVFDVPRFLDTMRVAEYDMASPSMLHAWDTNPSLQWRNHCRAHRTDELKVLFTVFPMPLQPCLLQDDTFDFVTPTTHDTKMFVDKSSKSRNEAEDSMLEDIGYEFTLEDLRDCHVIMGVIDHAVARVYDNKKDMDDDDDDLDANDEIVPFEYGYCEHVSLRLASNAFSKAATHRGGWKKVIADMNEAGLLYIQDGDNSSSDVEEASEDQRTETAISRPLVSSMLPLVDCLEQWFVWDNQGAIDMPFVAIAHLLMRADLPAHTVKNNPQEALEHYLESPDFLASAPNCVGLFVFTEDVAVQVRRKLETLGIGYVPTCVVRHPIGVNMDAKLYDPDIDLNVAANEGSVVLLGQQYRRVATLHRLKVKGRPKVWMPSRDDMDWLNWKAGTELKAEGVEADPTVKILRLESFDDYDRMVKQSIVVVDLWAAAANNSVMEAIALQVPFFIRRIAGPEEYLGADYPLFFSSTEELQEMLNSDRETLRKLLLEGHMYLKNLDSSRFTVQAFADDMHACALQGLSEWSRW